MTESDVPKQRQLNPFAFPSETNARFILFVVTALMLAFDITLVVGLANGVVKAPSANQAFKESLMLVGLPCLPVLGILIIAFIIYRLYPKSIRRKQNLKLLSQADDPKLIDAVQGLVVISGVSPSPSIEIAQGSKSADGQAFGFRNRYSLKLGGGSRLLLRHNPVEFRAIVLHELGHIANEDVTRTYFAQSIWIVFIVVIAFPILTITGFNFFNNLYELIKSDFDIRLFAIDLFSVLILVIQIAGTFAMMLAIRNSLLRVRETYADWRAMLWGAKDSLISILQRNLSKEKMRRWINLWRLHPAPEERLEALQNSTQLFKVTNELSFFIGIMLGSVLHGIFYLSIGVFLITVGGVIEGLEQLVNLYTLLSEKFSGLFALLDPNVNERIFNILIIPIFLLILSMILLTIITLFLLGIRLVSFVTDTILLEVQRESVADLIAGQRGVIPYLKLLKPAVFVSFGFLFGSLLLPYGYLSKLTEWVNPHGLTIFLTVFLITVTTSISTWLAMMSNRYFSQRVFGSYFGKLPSKNARRFLAIVFSGLLFIVFLPTIVGQFIIELITNLNIPFLFVESLLIIFAVSIIALILYAIMLSIIWVIVQFNNFLRKPKCPNCNQITQKKIAVGQVCEHCGRDLAPWLFVYI